MPLINTNEASAIEVVRRPRYKTGWVVRARFGVNWRYFTDMPSWPWSLIETDALVFQSHGRASARYLELAFCK